MFIPRETVYQALFDLASNVADWQTKSRKLKDFTDLQAEDCPALFQQQCKETFKRAAPNLPATYVLQVELWIYIDLGGDVDAVPSTALNPILDALEVALKPSPLNNLQTLGGVCQHCYIAGTVEIDEGVLGSKALAIVPIEILTT